MGLAIGIDIGGTFIDIVIADEDGIRHTKVPSTPREPAVGVLRGLRGLLDAGEIESATVERVIHGSTVATNALLEGTWGRTALVTTRGFRDVLEIGRQNRPGLYDLFYERPPAVVPRDRRLEVGERVDGGGKELRPVDTADVTSTVERIGTMNIDAVAVVFLFSYLDPTHERQVGGALAEGLAVPVVLSSDILPEFREYERTSTTVVTAALRPVLGAYLSTIEAGAAEAGLPRRWQIMQSSGTVTSATIAEREPARVILSGPAGGVEGARAIGARVEVPNLITMDMGGTSCDVAVIRDGRIGWSTSGAVGGHPVALPMVEIHTIGAGGGSVGWIDPGGALRVGPQSAGADPGPAAYGRGGERPTVTDAHVVLGHLDLDRPFGGLGKLDGDAAARAIGTVSEPLGLTVEETALGILEISNAAMERAIRVISVERGHDPRDFALLAFGGAGPLHAVDVARRLSIPQVIVPSTAGVLSAFGLLTAEAGHDESRSLVVRLEEIRPEELGARVRELREAGTEKLRGEGFDDERIRSRASVDLRYAGQSHELNVDLPGGVLDGEAMRALGNAFHDLHEARFGHAARDEGIEVVTVRVRCYSPAASLDLMPADSGSSGAGDVRDAWFAPHGPVRTRFLDRSALQSGEPIEGPAVLCGSESTVLLPEGASGRQDHNGILIVEAGRT